MSTTDVRTNPAAPVGVFVGLTVLDVVHRVTALPGRNEKITALSQFLAAGGPAANAAVIFAALGGSARLITAIGDSAQGAAARADLEAHGVEVIDMAGSDFLMSISAVAVLAQSGERAVTSPDAGKVAVSAHGIRDYLMPANVLLIDGHHPGLGLAAVRFYQSTATTCIADAGRWKPQFEALLPHVDTVIASADFDVPSSAGALPRVGATVFSEHELFRGTRLARTAGPDPIHWWTRDAGFGTSPSPNANGTVQPPVVPAVDTLGAGDFFHGAYAYFAATQPHADFASLLGQAAQVASLRVQRLGPRAWLDSLG